MVKRVATFLFFLTILVATALISHTTAGGPPVCAPEPYACAPQQPCAPQPCAPSSPFSFCGGILGACTGICGTCIGIPAAIMGAILAPPPPRPVCMPPTCAPPSCAPPTCGPQGCPPPMPYTCAPPPITKCKPVYGPPACGPQYQSCPPAGRMPLMMPLPRAEYAPSLPPMGGMVGQLFEMPFQLFSGVLSAPFGRPPYAGFAARPKSPTFGEYW